MAAMIYCARRLLVALVFVMRNCEAPAGFVSSAKYVSSLKQT